MKRISLSRRRIRLAIGMVLMNAIPGITITAADAAEAADTSASQRPSPTPEITTRQEKDQKIEEYRINGKLYAIKISPSRGETYMLVDHSGDGNFQMEHNLRIAVPEWTLLRW